MLPFLSVQHGHLALDADGEAVYELKEADEEGKWYFDISKIGITC